MDSWKSRKCLAGYARQGVQPVRLLLLIDHVIEERSERGTGQLRCGIRDHLEYAVELELRGDRLTDSIQGLQRARLLLERRQMSSGELRLSRAAAFLHRHWPKVSYMRSTPLWLDDINATYPGDQASTKP